MTDNIVKLRPQHINSLDDLFADAKEHGVTKALPVGISDDSTPYVNASSNLYFRNLRGWRC